MAATIKLNNYNGFGNEKVSDRDPLEFMYAKKRASPKKIKQSPPRTLEKGRTLKEDSVSPRNLSKGSPASRKSPLPTAEKSEQKKQATEPDKEVVLTTTQLQERYYRLL